MTDRDEIEALAELFIAAAGDIMGDYQNVTTEQAAAAIRANWNIYAGARRLRAGVPDAAERIDSLGLTGGVANVGDWSVEVRPGVFRIFGEDVARGWNACRDAMLAAAPAPEGAEAGGGEAFEAWLDRDWPLWRNDPNNPSVARLRRAWDASKASAPPAAAEAGGVEALHPSTIKWLQREIETAEAFGDDEGEAEDQLRVIHLQRLLSFAHRLASAPQQQCCMCGKRFDAREQSEGGGPDGAQLTDGRWTCSAECWERASDPQPSSIIGWMYEDQLPDGYPYDEMFPHSKVDGVRMFPVFGPPQSAGSEQQGEGAGGAP